MLQAFLDESEGDDIFVMAGYLSPASEWALFKEEWEDALKRPKKIDYFKYSECCVLILESKASGSSRIILKRSLNPDIVTTSTRIPETVIVVQPNESHLAHADLNKLLPWPVKNFRNGELPLRWGMDSVGAAQSCARFS